MKRIFCLVLCLLVVCMSALCVSAAEQEQKTDTNYIYFQVPTESTVAWKNFSMVFCHIWSEGEEGADFHPWQAKAERCTDLGNGYWSYDISALNFEADKSYAVIFSNENNMQTYNLTLTSACKGDIVVCEGDTCVNPVDSEKDCAVARWLTNGDKVFPSAQFGSNGEVLDPDNVYGKELDLTWGSSEGVSVDMPKVEVPTEPETEPQTEAQDTDTADTDSDIADADDTAEDNNLMWYIIIGGCVVLVLVIIVVIVLVKRKK